MKLRSRSLSGIMAAGFSSDPRLPDWIPETFEECTTDQPSPPARCHHETSGKHQPGQFNPRQEGRSRVDGAAVSIERIGCNGDERRARDLYRGPRRPSRRVWHRRHRPQRPRLRPLLPAPPARQLVADVHRTPVVDGDGVRQIVERRLAQRVEGLIGPEIAPKRVMITTAVDRFDLALSFYDAGYQATYCDLMFTLGVPIPIHSLEAMRLLAAVLLPVFGRLPMSMVYPTGSKQHQIVPKFERWYRWATVIAGDFNYVKRHLPDRLDGKIVVTNTTTESDPELLRSRGVKYLITSTPRLEGRTFGTNVMEALLTALAGKGRPLTQAELREMMQSVDITPTVTRLNE